MALVRIYFEASAAKERIAPTADTHSGELYYCELREGGEYSYSVTMGTDCGLEMIGYEYVPPRARRRSGSALPLLLVSGTACNLDLCSRSPTVCSITPMKEIIDDPGHGGRWYRKSRTAIVNVSYRRIHPTTGHPPRAYLRRRGLGPSRWTKKPDNPH